MELVGALVGCTPKGYCLGRASYSRQAHKFKRKGPLSRLIRQTEQVALSMNDHEALLRHAVTCGDESDCLAVHPPCIPCWIMFLYNSWLAQVLAARGLILVCRRSRFNTS